MKGTEEIEALQAELRRRVERRRASGELPPGLEAQLDRHFTQLVLDERRAQRAGDHVRAAIDGLRPAASFTPDRIVTSSRMPGGSAVHQLAGKAVSRQTLGVLQQVQAYTDALDRVLAAIADSLDRAPVTIEERLGGRIDVALDAVAEIEELRARVALLEQKMA